MVPVKHTNFRGDTYYLHSRKTKKGNNTYYFSKKEDGADVDAIPVGYEVYENPNGRVYLRKKVKQLFTDNDVKLITARMKEYSNITDFQIDIKKNILYIYTLANPELLSLLNGSDIEKYKEYQTELRFILDVDEDDRYFEVERFCYRGSIDDWIFLDGSDDLGELAKEYLPHLGEESFFDLV